MPWKIGLRNKFCVLTSEQLSRMVTETEVLFKLGPNKTVYLVTCCSSGFCLSPLRTLNEFVFTRSFVHGYSQ